MISAIDDALRPRFDAIVKVATRPTSIAAHIVGYGAWWASGLASTGLGNALGYESIVVGLVIVDQGVREIAERCRREAALQTKADALVVATEGADSRLAGLEERE